MKDVGTLCKTVRMKLLHSYRAEQCSRRREVDIRGVQYSGTEWGDSSAPLFIYLHGWADTGATFQFVVDALEADWHVVAPDWRGFGRSMVDCASYWFPDYLADPCCKAKAVQVHGAPLAHYKGDKACVL